MFQACVFDPIRDHTGAAQQPFPCLQHISLVPDERSGTLSLNAFYATQQLFTKACGNWLMGEGAEKLYPQSDRLQLAFHELQKLKAEDLDKLMKVLAALREDKGGA